MKVTCKIYLKLFFTSCLLFIFIVSNAQQSLVARLSAYKTLLDKNQIEKVHIHTNQPFYKTNDTIWFKAYVINANLNRLSLISQSLTVDLIDAQGDIVSKVKTKLNVGLADGYLSLSGTIKSGNYLLRAYTNSMKMFGNEFYFQRELIIRNKPDASSNNPNQNISLSFFPESGDLVEGLSSVVAFKAIGTNGLGVAVKGNIVDDKGKIITLFASEYLGMGKFQFKPEIGRKYTAELTGENNRTVKIQIPKAKESGYKFEVISTEDSLQLNVKSSADLNIGQLTLIAAQDGAVRYAQKLNLSRSVYDLSIPKSTFYTGIIQFTLFNSEGLPVAERLSFCNHDNLLRIEVDVKQNYQKRELVNLLVDLKNIDDQSEIGSLSVSVYSESAYPFDDDDEHSIYSDLLLTTDLKGFIEKPNAYFNKKDTKLAARNLDHLLLTQGWRRFSWKDRLSNELPIIVDRKNVDQEIRGKVMLQSGKPYVDGEVTLFQKGLNRNVFQTKTNKEGQFVFNNVDIIDTSYFVVSTNNATEKRNLKIQVFGLDQHQSGIVKPSQIQSYFIHPDTSSIENKKLDDLDHKLNGTNLNQVNIVAQKKGPITESVNLNGPGNADVIVLAKDLETTHDLSTYLLNHVNGLKTFAGKIYSRDMPTSLSQKFPQPAPMLVIWDGMHLNQESFSVSDINPNDVNSIEVLKGAFASLYGINGSGGVLIITSKKGKGYTNADITAKGIFPFSVLGFQKYRTFYSPEYDVQKNEINDFRKAIYWNPRVITTPDKKTELKFYNSDYTGKFKIVIEGINADGQIGRFVSGYELR